MALLVQYSDSESEGEGDHDDACAPLAKKRRQGEKSGTEDEVRAQDALPPLPSAFHDLYSSTVRTSTQDDPALHGGRKRVTPHIEGNWPTHVYLEWHPKAAESEVLTGVVDAQLKTATSEDSSQGPRKRNGFGEDGVKSLLYSELGVPLPLHISLSRPLVLRTEQRAAFLDQLKTSVQACGARAFTTRPIDVRWHPNEVGNRWFLVLGLEKTDGGELPRLLAACNQVAKVFEQPLLYAEDGRDGGKASDKFHISIAWSLEPQESGVTGNLPSLPEGAKEMQIPFPEVKIRIGQDVTTIPLLAARRKGLFS
jgi:U6 snRNA phosphodiesterase